MALRRQDWFEGWRLFGVLTLTVIASCIWIAGTRQFEVEGIRMVIRFTARTCLSCSAWHSAPRRWQAFGPMHGRGGNAATAAISASPLQPRMACTPSRS